jgi:alpha-L-fucosidase
MAAIGKWLAKNGEAIYATRPLAPWRKGEWAFTRNRHTNAEFAVRLWKDGEAKGGKSLLPAENPGGVKRVVHIATGKSIPFAVKDGGVELDFGKKFNGADEYADTFRICR